MADPLAQMTATQCALCSTDAHDRPLYPANFKPQDLSPEIFSARRLPDRVHYRIVTCRNCGLVRSNPVLNETFLARLYEQSHLTCPQESVWAGRTYASYFIRYLPDAPKDIHLLEIGCGNGTFLDEMYRRGFTNIFGIEPSAQAVAKAGSMQGLIHQGAFAPGLYPQGHFDVIAAFQVFDHISRPNEFLRDCLAYLKPGGKLLMVMHDINAWTARVLGRRCPMIDIEHPFLYNRTTLSALLSARGFRVQQVFAVRNRYPLSYWVKIMPGPSMFKQKMLTFLDRHPAGQIPLTLSAGNMGIIAIKNA